MSGARPGSVPVAGSTRAWPAFPGQFGIRASGGSAGALPGITATASRCRSSRPIASRCDASRNARGAGGTPAVALRSIGSPVAKGPRRSRQSARRSAPLLTAVQAKRRPTSRRMTLRPHRTRFEGIPAPNRAQRWYAQGCPARARRGPQEAAERSGPAALLDTCA